MRLLEPCLAFSVAVLAAPEAVAQPRVLVNHVGYDVTGPKRGALYEGLRGSGATP